MKKPARTRRTPTAIPDVTPKPDEPRRAMGLKTEKLVRRFTNWLAQFDDVELGLVIAVANEIRNIRSRRTGGAR